MTEKYLCIGGPKDGQWMESEGYVLEVVGTQPLLEPKTIELNGMPVVVVQNVVVRDVYERQFFGTYHKNFYLWIIHGMTDGEAIERLIANYRPQGANNG